MVSWSDHRVTKPSARWTCKRATMDSAESVTQKPVLGKSVGDMGRPPTRKNNARIWGIYYITLLYPKWLVHSVQFVKFNLVNDLVQRANKLSHIDILWDRWSLENFEHFNSCPVPLRVYFCIVSSGQINDFFLDRDRSQTTQTVEPKQGYPLVI